MSNSKPPGNTSPLPTGTLDAYRADLRAMAKEQKAVDREMAKSAKKGAEISKELLEKKKKIDAAIASQQGQIKRIDTANFRQRAQAAADSSKAARQAANGWTFRESRHFIRHAGHVVNAADNVITQLGKNGPLIDKAEAVSEALGLASHIPGPVGAGALAVNAALQMIITIYNRIKEERQFIREVNAQLRGGRVAEDEDEIQRRKANPERTKFTYIDPRLKDDPAHAGDALGGGFDAEEFKRLNADKLRAEKSAIANVLAAAEPIPAIGPVLKAASIFIRAHIEKEVESELNASLGKVKELTARAREKAELGDLFFANKDLAEIRAIDRRLMPGIDAEALFHDAQDRRLWAQRKSIEFMGVRHIDGRDE